MRVSLSLSLSLVAAVLGVGVHAAFCTGTIQYTKCTAIRAMKSGAEQSSGPTRKTRRSALSITLAIPQRTIRPRIDVDC